MTGKQERLADAAARNANAVGARRAGRTPILCEARADGVAVGRVVVAVDVVCLRVAHVGGRGGADQAIAKASPRKWSERSTSCETKSASFVKNSASHARARAALRYAANLPI